MPQAAHRLRAGSDTIESSAPSARVPAAAISNANLSDSRTIPAADPILRSIRRTRTPPGPRFSSTFSSRSCAMESSCMIPAPDGSARVQSEQLRLRFQVGLPGGQVNRDRDVLVRDQPRALEIRVAIRNPQEQVHFLVLLIGTGEVLDAVAECVAGAAVNAKVLDFKYRRVLARGQSRSPLLLVRLPSRELARRSNVKHDEIFADRVVAHEPIQVLVSDRNAQVVLQGLDCRFRIGRRRSR